MATFYKDLSDGKARVIIKRFGELCLIRGEFVLGVFVYPTEQQVLVRSGGSITGSSLKAQMRIPELYLHKLAGEFTKNDPVRILCRRDSPNFVMDEFDYNEGWIYRVSLVEDQEKPVDTAGTGWQ